MFMTVRHDAGLLGRGRNENKVLTSSLCLQRLHQVNVAIRNIPQNKYKSATMVKSMKDSTRSLDSQNKRVDFIREMQGMS